MTETAQLAELGLFHTQVPRYASYPTAAHFNSAVGADDHRAWIRAIPPGSALSLYVHVPFCRRICAFCLCRTQAANSYKPLLSYVRRLQAELRHLAADLPEDVTWAEIVVGGGTPTYVPAEALRDLFATIEEIAPRAEDARVSVEVDPAELDQERLDALAAAGLSHVAMGIQDFTPETQSAIGRIRDFESTKATIDQARAAGVRHLTVDLLYGLPHQNAVSLADSTQLALSLNPDRIAIYGYAHIPAIARRQVMIAPESLPGPEARFSLSETARQIVLWDGYVPVGIDHFVRPEDALAVAQTTGKLRRSFQGYTDGRASVQIGVGASAMSRFPHGYTQNASATRSYLAQIDAGGYATSRGHRLSGEDRQRAAIIDSFLCLGRARIPDAAWRQAILDRFGAAVCAEGDFVTIKDGARALTRMIASVFDDYEAGNTGASPAI